MSIHAYNVQLWNPANNWTFREGWLKVRGTLPGPPQRIVVRTFAERSFSRTKPNIQGTFHKRHFLPKTDVAQTFAERFFPDQNQTFRKRSQNGISCGPFSPYQNQTFREPFCKMVFLALIELAKNYLRRTFLFVCLFTWLSQRQQVHPSSPCPCPEGTVCLPGIFTQT